MQRFSNTHSLRVDQHDQKLAIP